MMKGIVKNCHVEAEPQQTWRSWWGGTTAGWKSRCLLTAYCNRSLWRTPSHCVVLTSDCHASSTPIPRPLEVSIAQSFGWQDAVLFFHSVKNKIHRKSIQDQFSFHPFASVWWNFPILAFFAKTFSLKSIHFPQTAIQHGENKRNSWKKKVTLECTRQKLWLKKKEKKNPKWCTYTHRQQILTL